MNRTVQCPGCGFSVELSYRTVKVATCPSCDLVCAIENDRADPTGKSATLTGVLAAVHTNSSGRLQGRPFSCTGRIRCDYQDGYWDEWFLLFEEGTASWLHEEDGRLVLSTQVPVPDNVPKPGQVRPGQRVMVGDRRVYVSEIGSASIIGIEGQLPRSVRLGQTLQYVDCIHDGETVQLEYFDNTIELYMGRPIQLTDIELD